MSAKLLIVSLVLVASVGGAQAWGPDGHAVVAHVATQLIQPEVLQAIDNELGKTNLSEASNWCDHYDHTDAGRWSSPLHYINYPGKACAFDWAQDCANDICNAGALVNFTKQVFDRSLSVERRQVALYFVLHLAGDLHQPLHVSSDDNWGGNKIKVSYDFSAAGGSTQNDNLHSVWDVDLIAQAIADLQQTQVAEVMEVGGGPEPYHYWPALASSLLDRMTKGGWRNNVTQWRHAVADGGSGSHSAPGAADPAADPREAALRAGLAAVAQKTAELSCSYGYAQPAGGETDSGDFLDRNYYLWARPVVEIQLAKAGARLAQLLSDAFAAAGAAEPAPVIVV